MTELILLRTMPVKLSWKKNAYKIPSFVVINLHLAFSALTLKLDIIDHHSCRIIAISKGFH